MNAGGSSYAFTPPSTPENPVIDYYAAASQTRRAETERHHLGERQDRLLREIIEVEVKMNITEGHRWHSDCPEYIATLKYIAQRKYHQALRELQRLVVKRLFELHKLNISQTGMSHILYISFYSFAGRI